VTVTVRFRQRWLGQLIAENLRSAGFNVREAGESEAYASDLIPPDTDCPLAICVGDSAQWWCTDALTEEHELSDLHKLLMPAIWVREPRRAYAVAEVFTTREREVGRLVADGLGNSEIAAQIGVREQSVKNIVRRLLAKSNCANRVQLALFFRK
jgi:DNA-binding CsgD family transcriptional regulator